MPIHITSEIGKINRPFYIDPVSKPKTIPKAALAKFLA